MKLEIRQTKNGYLVIPVDTLQARFEQARFEEDWFVFETFDALIDHLRSEFGEKPIAVIEANPRTIEVDPGLL